MDGWMLLFLSLSVYVMACFCVCAYHLLKSLTSVAASAMLRGFPRMNDECEVK